MGEYEIRDERILDTLPKIHVDVNDKQIEVTSLRGTWSVHPDLLWKPEALCHLQSFHAGKTTRYIFWHTEVQFVVEGKAQLSYSLPITRFSVEKTMTVEKWDAYVIPCGADIKFEVDPSGPLYTFCVAMPGPPRYRSDLMAPEARWPGLGMRSQ